MTPELRACPFCGADEAVLDGKADDVIVRCEGCGARGEMFYFSGDNDDEIAGAERDAIAAWNRRAAPPALAVREPVAYLRPALRGFGWDTCPPNATGAFPVYTAPDSNPQADQQTGSTGNAPRNRFVRCPECGVEPAHLPSCSSAAPLTRIEATAPSPPPPESRCKDEMEAGLYYCEHGAMRFPCSICCPAYPAAALPQEAPAPFTDGTSQVVTGEPTSDGRPLVQSLGPSTPPSALDVAALARRLRYYGRIITTNPRAIYIDDFEQAADALEREHARAENAERERDNSRMLVREICEEWNEPCDCEERGVSRFAGHDGECKATNIAAAKRALSAKVAALEADAARYRWLQTDWAGLMELTRCAKRSLAGAVLDKEIDAARASKGSA